MACMHAKTKNISSLNLVITGRSAIGDRIVCEVSGIFLEMQSSTNAPPPIGIENRACEIFKFDAREIIGRCKTS